MVKMCIFITTRKETLTPLLPLIKINEPLAVLLCSDTIIWNVCICFVQPSKLHMIFIAPKTTLTFHPPPLVISELRCWYPVTSFSLDVCYMILKLHCNIICSYKSHFSVYFALHYLWNHPRHIFPAFPCSGFAWNKQTIFNNRLLGEWMDGIQYQHA